MTERTLAPLAIHILIAGVEGKLFALMAALRDRTIHAEKVFVEGQVLAAQQMPLVVPATEEPINSIDQRRLDDLLADVWTTGFDRALRRFKAACEKNRKDKEYQQASPLTE